jgi:hypothetical protein
MFCQFEIICMNFDEKSIVELKSFFIQSVSHWVLRILNTLIYAFANIPHKCKFV